MADILDFISPGKSQLQLAQDAICADDVLELQKCLLDSDISQNSTLLNSPKENLLTFAVNRNADKCCLFLINKLKWSSLVHFDTLFCPVFLCFVQCYLPVCYEVFKTVDTDFQQVMDRAPKHCSLFNLLSSLIWPVDAVSVEQVDNEAVDMLQEMRLAERDTFEMSHSLLVLARARIRGLVRHWMVDTHKKKESTPNYFNLINRLNLPTRMIYFMAYSDTWPLWTRTDTKPYRGRPRLPEMIMFID